MKRQSLVIATQSKSEIDFSGEISDSMFGADMLRFVDTTPFQQSALALEVGGVRWPGEILVDPTYGESDNALDQRWINSFNIDGSVREYVYDLKHDNIIDTIGYPREGLREAFAYAATNNLAFTMLLPEDRYIDIDVATNPNGNFSLKLEQAHTDIDVFLERLFSGHYGEVPKDFTLQIGQEYYTGQIQYLTAKLGLDHDQRVAAKGQLYSDLAKYIQKKTLELTATGNNQENIDPKVLIHMGRLFGDYGFGNASEFAGSVDDAYTLSSQFDAEGFAALDKLLFQRYTPAWQGIADGLSNTIRDHTIADVMQVWEDAADAVGVPDKDFQLVAGWAISSTIREEIRAEYQGVVSDHAYKQRSDRAFEVFVQDSWDDKEVYGDKHASSVLQLFSELVGAGVDGATYYGVDLGAPGQISAKAVTGDIVTFTAGTLFEQMSANLPGTSINRGYLENSRDDFAQNGEYQLNTNVFESPTKIVAYVWVNNIDDAGLTVELNLFGTNLLNSQFSSVTSTSIRSVELTDWREKFDVVNLDARWGAGFQDAEAKTFEVAYRDANGQLPNISHDLTGRGITLEFAQDYEIIEVVYERDPDSFVFAETTPSGPVNLEGKATDDVIRGSDFDDIIRGRQGDDRLVGLLGSDTIHGDTGDDKIFGGSDGSMLFGGNGGDGIFAGIGADLISGGSGDDTVEGNNGDDIIFGNNGSDRLFGGSGQDAIAGGGDDDHISGGNGDDILEGNRGNDKIYGGAGADHIVGGEGNDILIGGLGADVFRFLNDFAHDQIEDFDPSKRDKIDLLSLDLGYGATELLNRNAAQQGDDVLLKIGENSITLLDFQLEDLSLTHFLI